MSIPPGLYYIEAYPHDPHHIDTTNLYATGNGINKTITVDPHKQPFIEHQVWHIQPVLGGKEGQYAITLHTKGSHFGGSWYPKDGKPTPETHVLTSENAYAWFISHADNDAPHIYTIRPPPTHIIGVTLYAGTNKDNQVIIKAVPVVPGALAPHWRITPVHGPK